MVYVDSVSFEQITCYKCGVVFLVPVLWKGKRLADHKTFYCPNGHGQYFAGKTDVQKLRNTKQRLENELAMSKGRAEHCQHRFNGMKGYVARLESHVRELEAK